MSDGTVTDGGSGVLERFTLPNGLRIRVHSEESCIGNTCVIHRPTDHHMRDWPLHWRGDRGIFERICTHGIGHPDPDQREYWWLNQETWQGVHGCDGCCGG